jgi:hypothetical protein
MGASVHLGEGPGGGRTRWSGSIAELRVGCGRLRLVRSRSAAVSRLRPQQGQDAADGGFLAGGFGQREVRLELGDDALGAALGAARAGRESRSRTPGSRAMHSSNRAWLVRTLQLVTLKNAQDF